MRVAPPDTKGNETMETVRDRMLHVMDDIIAIIDRIAADENAKPEDVATLPALVNCLVQISGYAVIEKKS